MGRISTLLLALILTGCTLALPGGKTDAPVPLAGDTIEVTKLDAPKGDVAKPADPAKVADPTAADPAASPPDATGKPDADPEPEHDPSAQPEEAAAETPAEEAAPPPAPLSPEALACQKRGGRYVKTGSGDLRACVKVTGEEGKTCRRETDCIGACLARSGTCAPVTPLFGCNDILQADGQRVTLCLD